MGIDQSKLLTPSWNLFPRSYRLAIKSYEQITILFFIPLLFSVLGSIYLAPLSFSELMKHSLTSRQSIGAGLMLVWLLLSIFNFGPAVYFRVESVKSRTIPSLRECYKEGLARMWRLLAIEIVAYLLIFVGLIFLLVPGIIFFRRYSFSVFYAVDNPQLGIRKILSKSSSETRPFRYSVYGAYGVVFIVSFSLQLILGSYILGAIVAALLGYSVLFIPALRYQEISGFKSGSKPKKRSAKTKEA